MKILLNKQSDKNALFYNNSSRRNFLFIFPAGTGKPTESKKPEDIEEKLRDISKRLEKLGTCDESKVTHPPPDMTPMDSTTKELLFTRLFPTVKHHGLTFH